MKEYTPRISEHTKTIILWREAMLRKNDTAFFEMMKTYLGKLKMPYDKNKLIPQLETFLLNEENQKSIISLLSESDLIHLSAVHFIPDANLKRISSFFHFDFPENFVEEIIYNLEDRLLVFSYLDEETNEILFKINPHLEDAVLPLLSKEKLFSTPEHIPDIYAAVKEPVSAEFIIAFLSYINSNGDLCKKDGSFKKRAATELRDIFGESFNRISLLRNSLLTLGIIKENADEEYFIDWKRLENFASLSKAEQAAYLTATATTHLSREMLQKNAGLFLQTFNSIPQNGISKASFIKKGFFTSLKPLEDETVLGGMGGSRFSAILNRARILDGEENNSRGERKTSTENYLFQMELLECFTSDAITYGFIKSEKQEEEIQFFEEDDPLSETFEEYSIKPKFYDEILYKNFNADQNINQNRQQMVHIDGAFNLSLMPGYGFSEIIPLIKFMNITKFDTVSQFAITKESVIRAFESGLTDRQIISTLKDCTNFSLPQTLIVSIEEWYKTFDSVKIYSGFVLKLNIEEAFKAEKNPLIAQHIVAKISDGIFLLDTESEKETNELLRKSGFEMSRTITSRTDTGSSLSFGTLNTGIPGGNELSNPSPKFKTNELDERRKLLKKIYSRIKEQNLSREEIDHLCRIANAKLIISEKQDLEAFGFTEVTTAESMDYSGKLHQLENAIRNQEQIVFTTIHSDEEIKCNPVLIDKTSFSDGAYIVVEFSNGERDSYSVGQIKYIHRIPKFGHSKSRG